VSYERPKIGSIAPWFGGKRSLAPAIVAELGPHRSYFEPFCGSMAVLLAKPPAACETANDLHGDLINLAMVLASDRCADLHDRLARTLMADAVHVAARDAIAASPADPPPSPRAVEDRHVDRAADYFAMSWMGRNGISGTTAAQTNQQIAVRWTPGGGGGGARFRNAVDTIPAWHQRLRNVLILSRDGFDVIDSIDDAAGVSLYVDPPYLGATRSSGAYTHDFADGDHERLAAGLSRFSKARVVVSYYAAAALADLYPGWTVRECIRNKSMSLQNSRGGKPDAAPEVLVLNGPSLAPPSGLFGAEGGAI